MHGKITLTVPMDKIPAEVKKILLGIEQKLNILAQQVQYTANTADRQILNTLDQIREHREQLTSLDLSLEDCYSILVGYLNYEAKKRQTVQPSLAQEVKNDNVTDE